MKLIMNLPSNKTGWNEFNHEFAKLQSKLILLGINKLNISFETKEKLLYTLLDKIKERF